MTAAQDIVAYLAAHNISATLNHVDETKVNTIGVIDTGGYSPERCHGTQSTVLDRPSVQIIVRGDTKRYSLSVLSSIIDTLDGLRNVTLNNQYYLYVDMVNQPTYLGRVQTNSGETNEWSVNFSTIKQR